MADNELQIKISGDTSGFKGALDSVKDSTTQLQSDLNKTAEAGQNIFAALGLEKIGEAAHQVFDYFKEQLLGAIEAYGEGEQAALRLTNALQNQGIYTEELIGDYNDYADSVSRLSGIQTDEITKSQAIAQSFLGQVPITEDLTKAIADLAVQQGISLPAAAEELGKAIGNGTGQLLRQGLQFSATDTEADRYAKTLEFVQVKAGGFAETANSGVGSVKGLQTAFKEAQEELGERFAPAFTAVVEGLTDFIRPAEESNEEITNLKASFLAAGVVLSGIAVVLPIVGQAFILAKAAAAAFNLELTATKVALASIGIGLIIIAITELYLHWESVGPRITQIVKAMVETVSGAFQGLSTIISGAFHLDTGKIKEGLTQIQQAFVDGAKTATSEIPKATEAALDEQDKIKKKYADKAAKEHAENEAARRKLQQAEDAVEKAEVERESAALVAIKKKEVEILKQIVSSKNTAEKALLKQHLAEVEKMEQVQQTQDQKRDQDFANIEVAAQKKLKLQLRQIDTEANAEKIKQIKASEMTVQEVQQKAYTDELQTEVNAHNTFLEEQNKFGTAYAAINQVMHRSEVEGFKQATSELTQLTSSKNIVLKDIGKAASIANIVIKTAESAMNIYAGFSAIPIVGIPLGVAGAAAAVAFGIEQVGNVIAAADGGMITGGIPGRDSVPAMLMPGELVVPTQNFNEVINSVSAQRTGESQAGRGGSRDVNVQVGFSGPEASRVLTMRQNEDKALGISRQRV